MAQEPSSGSGVKRTNLEAIRRASCQSAGGTTCSETCILNTDGRIGGVCDERRGNS